MKLSTVQILKNLIRDIGLDSSDAQYVMRRLKNEGVRFCTSTLPRLWKAISFSLKVGSLKRDLPGDCSLTAFAWKGRSLRYFRSLLDRLFNPVTGLVLPNPCPHALRAIRTLSEYMYKTCFDFSSEQLDKAKSAYLEQENNMVSIDSGWCNSLRRNFEKFYPRVSRPELHHVLGKSRLRFGPGSLNGISGLPYWKWKRQSLSDQGVSRRFKALSGYFRPYPSCKASIRLCDDRPRVSKVLFVPKNADKPRVISKEQPDAIQLQMAFFDWSTAELEAQTDGRIQFTDQSQNRRLAQLGSVTGEYATLDLSAASDSVQFGLCQRVFRNSPAIRWFINHARATSAALDGLTIPLRKLAGMGSGLTFPILSLIIHISVCTQVSIDLRLPYKQVMRKVYTYGDDIIIPTEWVSYACSGLRKSGLKVNEDKSFFSGPFRESCGGDYLSGVDVVPVRLRLMQGGLAEASSHCQDNGDYQIVIQKKRWDLIESHCRELLDKGFTSLAEYYYREIEKQYRLRLPYVSRSSAVLGRVDEVAARLQLLPRKVNLTGVLSPRYYVREPMMDEFHRDDPYRFLGRLLEPNRAPSMEVAAQLGEIPVPHAVKITRKRVVSHDALTRDVAAEPVFSLKSSCSSFISDWGYLVATLMYGMTSVIS